MHEHMDDRALSPTPVGLLCVACSRAAYWACMPTEEQVKSALTFSRPSRLGKDRTISLHSSLAALGSSSKYCASCGTFFSGWSSQNVKGDEALSVKLIPVREGGSLVSCLASELWHPDDGGFKRHAGAVMGICGSDNEISRRAIWSGASPVFIHRAALLHEWLDRCQREHKACVKTESQELPARFLDLQEQGRGFIHVVETLKLRKSSGNDRYVALSHCWGPPGDLTCKTTKENVSQHMGCIRIENLPRTFQDALRITVALGIRYLWIDALCIVQNDSNDWTIEAAKMASVYSGSYVTLAATSAMSSSGGMFLDDIGSPTLTARGLNDDDDGGIRQKGKNPGKGSFTCFVRNVVASRKDIWNAFLSQRAWVLQELVLSRRLVHFTDRQLYYQCRDGMESEDGTLRDRGFTSIQAGARGGVEWGTMMGIRDLSTPIHALQTWSSWVMQYTSLALTFSSDRMAAMAGMIRYYKDNTGDTPILGLWSSTLWYDLGWCVHESNTHLPASSRLANIPSWTWLSFPPSYSTDYLKVASVLDAKTQSRLKVVTWDIEWADDNAPFTSKLKNSRLLVSAPLVAFPHPLPPPLSAKVSQRLDFDLPEDEFVSIQLYLDYIREDGKESDLYLMCLYSDPIYEMFVLLEKQNSQEHVQYTRLGAGALCRPRGREGYFDVSPVVEVLLG